MSTSTNTVIYEPAVIEVSNEVGSIDASVGTLVDIEPCSSIEMPVSKKEYTIISDGLYIPESADTPPDWVINVVNNAINTHIGDYITDVVIADGNLLDALDAIEVAHNAYQEMVHIDVRVDEAIATRLTTLNSRLDASDATIITLNTTKVTAEQASAISINSIASSLNDGSPDSIGGRFANINSSITTLSGNVTSTRDLLESRYGELNTAVADLKIEVGTSINEVYSSFAYDSTLRIGDDSFRSGFGLNASVKVPIPGEPGVYRSEFWIDAQRFKFTNSNKTGAVSPFTIDASGSLPQISFNGSVSFSNVTGPDKPEDGATRNQSRGAWTNNTAYTRGDVVTADGNSWVARTTHASTTSNRPPVLSTTTSTTWALLAAKGDQGVTGLTVTTVKVYRRSSTTLDDDHKPTTAANGSIVYNFSTGAVSGINNGWSSAIPAGTDPLYVTVASVDAPFTATTVTIPASRFSTPVKYVENGLNTATVFLFRRTDDDTTPNKPNSSNGVTYDFTTHSLTPVPSGWAEDVPTTGGRYRWVSKATAVSTSDTDVINNSEWSTPRLIAEDGIDGAEGASGAAGADARTVDLIPSTSAIAYDSDGGRITNSVSFTAYSKGLTDTAYYRFYVNDVAQGTSATTNNTYNNYVPSATYSADPISIEVEVREGSSFGSIVARDEVTLYPIKAGSDALTVILSNEAHAVPATSTGHVTSYAGSGTTISVYQGSTELQYETGSDFPASNGMFRVVPTVTSITVGGRSVSGRKALVTNASNMTADAASISFAVNIRNTNGTTTTITKVQTFSKSRRGTDGTNGTNGTNGVNGAPGSNGTSAVTVFIRSTALPTLPNWDTANSFGWSWDSPPTDWSSTVPAGTAPIWEATGVQQPTGWWRWSHRRVSAEHWTEPGETTINGNMIFTGRAYVDTLQIQGRAVTVSEYAETGLFDVTPFLTNNYTTRVVKKLSHPGYFQGASGVIVYVTFVAYSSGGNGAAECRVTRTGWQADPIGFGTVPGWGNAYALIFYDPFPPDDPEYYVQFRASGEPPSDHPVRVWQVRCVFSSGKR